MVAPAAADSPNPTNDDNMCDLKCNSVCRLDAELAKERDGSSIKEQFISSDLECSTDSRIDSVRRNASESAELFETVYVRDIQTDFDNW
jgi:hypothetical protein